MRIIHVFMPNGYVIIKNYIKFIKENFPSKDHYYVVIGKSFENSLIGFPRDFFEIKYFQSYKKNFFEIIKHLNKFNKILYHGLYIPTSIKLVLMFYPSVIKKIIWISWGFDLYHWKENSSNIKSKIINIIEYMFRKQLKYFVAIFPPDEKYFKKKFKSNAKSFYAPYVGELYNTIYSKKIKSISLNEKKIKKDCINIQIGHSSARTLNHIEVLEELLRFKKENIHIYLPLSYGNHEYGDSVEEKAKLLFGYKITCIRDFMKKEEYMNFLLNIDIAIFNTNRQIALGNIIPLFFMEKKVYLPNNSIMYNYFVSTGINICDYKKIRTMNYEGFIEQVNMKNAKKFTQSLVNKNKMINLWAKIFETSVC